MDHTRLSAHRETALFLECVSVFSELPEEHIEFLAGLSGRVHLPAGEDLFEEGDPGDAVFVIRRGKVEVLTHLPNGEELVLAQLGEHELIGEHYLLEGARGVRGATVRASQPTDLIRISHDTFDRLLKRNPMVAKQLAWRRMQREQENLARRSELYRIIRSAPAQTPTLRMCFQPGEAVFREGDAADGVYLVNRGVACVYREASPEVVLSEVVVGQCFGERAVVSDTPRSASVRAKTELEVLRIPKENFLRLHEQSADLRDVVCGLEFSYQLPARGMALQFTRRREDEDAIERLYRLPDNREFLSSFMVRRKVFRIERLDTNPGPHQVEHTWRDQGGGLERSLRLGALGEIVGMAAAGPWDQLPQVIEAALDATPLAQAARGMFEQTGTLPLEALREPHASEPDPLACFCLNVPDGKIRELVKVGYSSFEALRKTTGCGSVCGGCESHICELVKHPDRARSSPDWIPVKARGEVINQHLRSFMLTPEQTYPAWSAGQYVLVEGRVHGAWVSRPYLIASAEGVAPLEIIVQREPRGAFSSWLFDGPAQEKQLRISAPRSDVTWRGERATVCIGHDMGLVQALAIARSAVARSCAQPVYVVCFISDERYSPLVRELKAAAREHPNVTVVSHAVDARVRVSWALAKSLKKNYSGAEFYLCAFAHAMTPLHKLVKRLRVPQERVHVELLHHGAPPQPGWAGGMGKLTRLGLIGALAAGLIAAGLLLFSKSVGGWLGG